MVGERRSRRQDDSNRDKRQLASHETCNYVFLRGVSRGFVNIPIAYFDGRCWTNTPPPATDLSR